MSVPPPPRPLICAAALVPAGTRLLRIHESRFSAAQLNPGLGDTRFAPIWYDTRRHVPHLYAATSFECAAYEYVFHDIDHGTATRTVPLSRVFTLAVSELVVTRDLSLAGLFQPDLNRIGIERKQLIDTPASTYPETRKWSLAIHNDNSGLHGLVWTSRKCDPDRALLMFGDRLSASDLAPVQTEHFASSPGRLAALVECGRRAGITLSV